MGIEYKTKYKNTYCDKCEANITHISKHGNNYRCLKCLFEDIEEIINQEPVHWGWVKL